MDIDHAKYPTTCTHREPCTLFCLRHFETINIWIANVSFTVYCEYIVHILLLQTELYYHCTDTIQASQFIAVIV